MGLGKSLKKLVKAPLNIIDVVNKPITKAMGPKVEEAVSTTLNVIGGIGGAAALAGAAGLGAAGSAGGAVAGSAGSANAAAQAADANALASIVGSIKDTVSSIKETVGGALKPITDTFHDLTEGFKSINEGLIQPIVGPIRQIIDSYDALHKQISRDLKDGLRGILRIPTDIANALDSVDASIQRGMSQLGFTLTDKLNEGYAKSAPGVAAQGFDKLIDALDGPSRAMRDKLADPARVTLGEPMDVLMFERDMKWINDSLDSVPGWVATVGRTAVNALRLVNYLGYLHKPFLDAVEDRVNREHPTQELGIGDVLEAMKRGILSTEQGIDEIRTHGYSVERVQVMRELSKSLTSMADGVQYVLRGFIDEVEFLELAFQHGFDNVQARLMLKDAQRPPAIGDAFEAWNRSYASFANSSHGSLNDPPPDVLKLAGRQAGLSPEYVETAWRAHWALLAPAQVIDAYFKGFLSWEQATHLLLAQGLPSEFHATYRDLLRPTIPARSAMSMVRAGILDPGRLVELMRREGWREEDIELLVAFGTRDDGETTSEQADTLHGLSQTTVLALYDDGVLDRETATSLLTRLGIGSEAAELQLMLRDVERQARERKSLRASVVARTKSGALTIEEAYNELTREGFTTREIEQTLTEIERARNHQDKQPSVGSLSRMVKNGIIGPEDYKEAVVRAGYSDAWAERLLQLALLSNPQPEGDD